MTQPRKPYIVRKGHDHLRLRLVTTPAQSDSPPNATHDHFPPGSAHDPHALLGQIVMHATMAWVTACTEQDAHTVDVANIAPATFDATAHLTNDATITLRVHTKLETGPRLTLTIEPIHP